MHLHVLAPVNNCDCSYMMRMLLLTMIRGCRQSVPRISGTALCLFCVVFCCLRLEPAFEQGLGTLWSSLPGSPSSGMLRSIDDDWAPEQVALVEAQLAAASNYAATHRIRFDDIEPRNARYAALAAPYSYAAGQDGLLQPGQSQLVSHGLPRSLPGTSAAGLDAVSLLGASSSAALAPGGVAGGFVPSMTGPAGVPAQPFSPAGYGQ